MHAFDAFQRAGPHMDNEHVAVHVQGKTQS